MTDDIYDDDTPKKPKAGTRETDAPAGTAADAADDADREAAASAPPRAGDDARAPDFDDAPESADASEPSGASDGSSHADGPELPVLPDELPVLPVRDVVVFNYMILPLFVGREKSVQAVDAALNGSRYLMICTQRDESVDDPAPEDLHATGTVVMIMRMLKMPDNRLKVLVQGISRARVESFGVGDGYLTARVETLPEPELGPPTVEQEAMMRAAREQSEKILSLRGIATSDIMAVLNSVDDPGRLADLIAANLRMKVSDAQAILECTDPDARLRLVNEQLVKEVEVASMQAKIQSMAREGMDKAQKDYFLREQMKAIRRELGESGNEDEELEDLTRSLERAGLPREVRKEADKQLRRLASMHPDSSEATVVRTYLEWLAELPWAKLSRDRLDINKAKVKIGRAHV